MSEEKNEEKNEDQVSISMNLTVAGFKELLARPGVVLDKAVRREGDLVMKLYMVITSKNLYIVAAESKVQVRGLDYDITSDSVSIECIGYAIEGTKAGIVRLKVL